ncbi:MAG: leucine-rich repeat domain-containing protein [Prevotella sp.]|nr:leucine-rich repeat domain-containing protein [Prevotella sp.]
MKPLRLLLATLLAFACTTASAHDIEVANAEGKTIYYVWTNDNTELAVSYQGDSYLSTDYTGNVVIPSSVDYEGKTYLVTSIGYRAFSYCSGLTSVTIPNTVTSIGEAVFAYCSDLTSVTVPNSVTSIGDRAFLSCSSLTSVTIPNSVTSIGSNEFSLCTSLTIIKVDEGNTVYDSRDNCNAIIEKASNTLIAGCQTSTIPNSVTSIGLYAFSGCTGLTSITIPNSVTAIGQYAFSYSTGLTSISIPNSVTNIGEEAFSYCSGLTDVCCYAEDVPTTHSKAFDHSSYNTSATLHVPASSIESYRSTEPWKSFFKIEALSTPHYEIMLSSTEGGETTMYYTNVDDESRFVSVNNENKPFSIQYGTGVTFVIRPNQGYELGFVVSGTNREIGEGCDVVHQDGAYKFNLPASDFYNGHADVTIYFKKKDFFDVNNDGNVDISDVTKIVNEILKQE